MKRILIVFFLANLTSGLSADAGDVLLIWSLYQGQKQMNDTLEKNRKYCLEEDERIINENKIKQAKLKTKKPRAKTIKK